ncbi:hypothetical protein [Massilia sp.]|uniref:hypothetical protein n=1 Tax=Massilia sp. TaxID=1882437 RepID=UPI00352DF863
MHYIVLNSDVDVAAPLIYMWEIHDLQGKLVGRYIGKANGGHKRPTQHYPRNVTKLCAGKPYKQGKNYRRVHYGLSDAVKAGHRISLTYLCNVSKDQDIFKIESHYIKKYGCDADDGIGLNGRWKGTPREVVVAECAWSAQKQAERAVDERDTAYADAVSADTDLDDFLEFFDDKQRNALEIRVNGKSCSVWSEGKRILRAKQDSPGARIWIKLVQSSWRTETVKFAWDGSDSQIEMALDAEREVLRARGEDPKF